MTFSRMIGSFIFLIILESLTVIYGKEGEILELTNENYDKVIKNNEMVMVEFYMDGCVHCQNFEPEYKKLAARLAYLKKNVVLTKVNGKENKELAKKEMVSGYPTIIFYNNGSAYEYRGRRTVEEMAEWFERKTGNPLVLMKSRKELEDKSEIHPFFLMGFFFDEECEEYKAYRKAAQENGHELFYYTTDHEFLKDIKITKNTIMFFKNMIDEERLMTYDGPLNSKDIDFWATGHSIPLLNKYDVDNMDERLFKLPENIHCIVIFPISGEGVDQDVVNNRLEEMSKAAKEYRGKAVFIYMDSNNKDGIDFLNLMELSDKDVPIYMAYNYDKDLVYYPDEKDKHDISATAMSNLLSKFFKGQVEPRIKSQPLPDNWNDKRIKILVQKTIDDFVQNDSTKAVVLFMNPQNCEMCPEAEGALEKVAEELKDEKDIVFGKIDHSLNELRDPEYETDVFPVIKLFPQNPLLNQEYYGDFKAKRLKKFILTGSLKDDDDEEEEEEKKKKSTKDEL